MESHSYLRLLIAKPDQTSIQMWYPDKFLWHSAVAQTHRSTPLSSQRKKSIKAWWYQGTKNLPSIHGLKSKWLKGRLNSTGLDFSFPLLSGKSQCVAEHELHSHPQLHMGLGLSPGLMLLSSYNLELRTRTLTRAMLQLGAATETLTELSFFQQTRQALRRH